MGEGIFTGDDCSIFFSPCLYIFIWSLPPLCALYVWNIFCVPFFIFFFFRTIIALIIFYQKKKIIALIIKTAI